ncbi:MAG TPA: hypothetical protein VKB86_17340 [Pyrinomonadaceae bacterium]|nr:hypothetical protein [Pyrinomonadaceae bacterium]
MPEQNKKLAGFEALYKVDQEKRQRQETKTAADNKMTPTQGSAEKPERTREKVSKSESNIVSNITNQTADVFEPTTFKADRRKVKALKRLALDLEPTRKLQNLFDEALTDLLNKYGRTIE